MKATYEKPLMKNKIETLTPVLKSDTPLGFKTVPLVQPVVPIIPIETAPLVQLYENDFNTFRTSEELKSFNYGDQTFTEEQRYYNNRILLNPMNIPNQEILNIPGLSLWIDATNSAKITVDNASNVTNWNDQSLLERSSIGSTTWTRGASNIDGKTVIKSAIGNSSTLSYSGAPAYLSTNNMYYIFMVAKYSVPRQASMFSQVGGVGGFYIDTLGLGLSNGGLIVSSPLPVANRLLITVAVDSSLPLQFNSFINTSLGSGIAYSGWGNCSNTINYNELEELCEVLIVNQLLSLPNLNKINNYLLSKWIV
jgi:hypothetical protein